MKPPAEEYGRRPQPEPIGRERDPRRVADGIMHGVMCQCRAPFEAQPAVEIGNLDHSGAAERGMTQFEDAIGGNVSADPMGVLDDGVGIESVDIDLGLEDGGDLLR